jgi:hypothetical protein
MAGRKRKSVVSEDAAAPPRKALKVQNEANCTHRYNRGFSGDIINIILDLALDDIDDPTSRQTLLAACAHLTKDWYCATITHLYHSPTRNDRNAAKFERMLSFDTSPSTMAVGSARLTNLVRRIVMISNSRMAKNAPTVASIVALTKNNLQHLSSNTLSVK